MGQSSRNQRWPEKYWLTYHRGMQQQAASTFADADDMHRALHDIGIPVESVGAGKYRRGDDAWVWGFGLPPVNAVHQPGPDPLIITSDADIVIQAGPGGTVELFDAISSRLPIMRLDAESAERLCARIVRALGGPESDEIATRLDLIGTYIGEPLVTQPLPPRPLAGPVPPVGPVLACRAPVTGPVEVYSGFGSSTRFEWAVITCDEHRSGYIRRAAAAGGHGYTASWRPASDDVCGDVVAWIERTDKIES